jgi:hypothetical protein
LLLLLLLRLLLLVRPEGCMQCIRAGKEGADLQGTGKQRNRGQFSTSGFPSACVSCQAVPAQPSSVSCNQLQQWS